MTCNISSNFFLKTRHCLLNSRYFHVSSVSYSVKKQGLKLCKMLKPKAQKNIYATNFENNTLPSIKSLTKVDREPGKQGRRRIAVLNKLFMKTITDLMSNGSSSIDVIGRGIEISKVQISQNLQTVNVFWICKGNSSDDETHSILSNLAGPLRHELSVLRLMGEVPYIQFVKDRHEALIVDLDRKLSEADFGDDYAPAPLGDILKSEFSLDMKLSPEIKAKIKQLEDQEDLTEIEPIPVMTHHTFGLDHEKMMNRMLAARKKSRDAWANLDQDNNVISYRKVNVNVPDVDLRKQKQELANFLLKRKIEQNKQEKQLRDVRTLQVLPDEYEEDDEGDYYTDEEDDNFMVYQDTQENWSHDFK